MADFNQPTLSTLYADVMDILKARDVDAISLAESPTNPPTGAMRWNRTDGKFQEWSGAAWVDRLISLAGGGTGASTAAGARTNLGLGSIATQNSNAINITGGTIAGLASLGVSGDTVISGRLDINSAAVNALDVAGGIRAGTGNVDIIGTDGRIPALSSTYFASLTAQGAWSFNTGLTIINNDPYLLLNEPDAVLDEKFWRLISVGGNLVLQPINDAFTIGGVGVTFKRNANVCFEVELGSDAMGSGSPGKILTVGRNTDAVTGPGHLCLVDSGGVPYYLFVTPDGKLRISGTPVNSGTELGFGTIVGTQS